MKLGAVAKLDESRGYHITAIRRLTRIPHVIRNPQIAIDFRWLDSAPIGSGQFRYSVDLIRGLAELRPQLRFVVLGSKPQPVEEIADVFHDRDWSYRAIARMTGKGSLYREQLRYFQLLRGLDIDLLHSLHTFVPAYPPVPVVETVYDLMYELFPEYAAAVKSREYRFHKWSFRHFVARAMAISQTTANDLSRLWRFPAERIDVVYLGPKLPQTTKNGKQLNSPIILSPYNLEPRKNLLRLLEAAAKLKASRVEFRLVLFGRAAVNNERERGFQENLSRMGLESCTELTGQISDDALSDLYGRCAVFVFPSLYEGFGLPVLEAMTAGARVVAHNASAMAEVLGDAGFLTNMKEASNIAEGITNAMKDNVRGAKARERAQLFSRERMARETLAVYHKTLRAQSDAIS